jgi:hypothetical protein
MNVNGKKIAIENYSRNGWRRDKGEDKWVERVNPSMRCLIYCKNFSKCHNVPLPSTIIIIF